MPVDGVASTSSLYSTPPTRAPKQKMDGEMFLALLVTQLRAQDPSSPMDTNAMISQTSQLASMEQLTTLTGLNEEGFSLQMRMAGSALIGKTVSYLDADGSTKTGVASSVSFASAVPTIRIGDKDVRLDAISAVTDTSPPATPAP